ncbi:ABC transporter ATP-binding protein [Halosimplex salinum]|uniref:ABC transporter ATP-binding protein n=1 Tax=Halosimplex salinum TaxID=1710538 RepID=UPI000F486D2C|nr:ABC transporter ATP-binding protein [Halosimplex salinum]
MSESPEYEVPEHIDNPLWHLVRRYARPYAPRYLVAIVGTALAQVPQRVPAVVVGVALDAILLSSTPYTLPGVPTGWIPTTTEGQVTFTIGLLVTAYGLDAGLSWFAGRISGTARLRTLHDIRVDTFDALVDRDLGFFDERQTGDVMSVLNNDVSNLNGFGNNAVQGLRFVMQIAVAFAFMAALHLRLAALLLVLPVGLALLGRWYTTRVEPVYEEVRESVGRVNAMLEDSIDGIATVKSFAREDRERDAVAGASREYRDRNWSVIRLRLAFNLSSWSVASFSFIGLFALGAYINLNGAPPVLGEALTAGTLVTFLLYSKSFYGPIRQLMLDVLDSYENALASSKRIVAVLETDRDADDTGETLDVREGRIEYDDVCFGYQGSDEQQLTDVSITAEPGSLVGIVGPTGAGKSTITKLLFRFYEPDSGAVRIDGTDVADVSPHSLREHLGYVSQDPFLFYGTIRENIGYAVDDPGQAEIERAAKLAGAHEFVSELPDGYDTQVGERGESLSGGQRQRVAIARALLREPEILVLDEATSHVDNETERQIQESIDALAGERTTLAIAHRLSTVRNADTIVVVDDGRVVEQGTHEELVERDGLYADLWKVQVGDIDAVSESFLARARGEDRPSERVESVLDGEVSR